jgi:hypothetical protein
MVDLKNRAVVAIRVAAIDPDLAVAQAALVRERHRLVVEQQVRDRPGHAPMIPPIGIRGKPLYLVAETARAAQDKGRPLASKFFAKPAEVDRDLQQKQIKSHLT